MKALDSPLNLEAGEYSGFRTTVRDPTGTMITDLTSYRAYIRIGGPVVNGLLPTATLELSTENGGITRDGSFFRWAITAENSRLLRSGRWQMYVIPPSDRPTRIYDGAVTLNPEYRPPSA